MLWNGALSSSTAVEPFEPIQRTVIGPAPGGSVGTLIRNLRPSLVTTKSLRYGGAGSAESLCGKAAGSGDTRTPSGDISAAIIIPSGETKRARAVGPPSRIEPALGGTLIATPALDERERRPGAAPTRPTYRPAPAGRELTLRFLGSRVQRLRGAAGDIEPPDVVLRRRIAHVKQDRSVHRVTNRSGTSRYRSSRAAVRRRCPWRASRRGREGRGDSTGRRAVHRSLDQIGEASVCEDEVRAVTKFRPRSSMPRSAVSDTGSTRASATRRSSGARRKST